MAAVYVWEFEVVGTWDTFPYDMLRYDSCWPASEGHGVAPPHYRDDRGKEIRRIQLRGLRPPTHGRWESFGWAVKNERKGNRLDR